MQLKVNNYISPAVENLETFLDYYDDDKIGFIQIYEWDGTSAMVDSTITAVASTVSDLKNNIVKDVEFLFASVEYDTDGTVGAEATHVYIVVQNKCIVSQNDTETGVLKYLFETLLDVDTVANMMVALSGSTSVILTNSVSGDNATLVTTAENSVSSKFNATFNI